MTAMASFTAYLKVVPGRGMTSTTNYTRRGGRWDYYRELQRLSVAVYEELLENAADYADELAIANPGGGQNKLSSSNGSIKKGCAVIPQFGNKPALLMIEGHYKSPSTAQPSAEKKLIHAGRLFSGYSGSYPWDTGGLPTATVASEVTTIKALIEAAITAVTDDTGSTLKLFRLEYKGSVWGNKGHHFP